MGAPCAVGTRCPSGIERRRFQRGSSAKSRRPFAERIAIESADDCTLHERDLNGCLNVSGPRGFHFVAALALVVGNPAVTVQTDRGAGADLP